LSTLGQADLPQWVADEYMAIAIKRHIGGNHWWAGLYPCQEEQDVWVLRTRRVVYR
jgi:hypothetical protein